MEKTTIALITLVIYKLVLIGIGFWAHSRTRNEEDFFLGGRGLGPLVAAISYSSSASSAWTLLGLSGLAFVLGVSTIWIVIGSIIGMLVAWFWIAPRLMEYSRRHDQITLTEFLADDSEGPMRRNIVVSASTIVIFCFTFYVAAQFQDDPLLRAVPVIMLTALVSPGETSQDSVAQSGSLTVLPKPVNMEKLTHCLLDAIDSA